jgi:hypothetical protein
MLRRNIDWRALVGSNEETQLTKLRIVHIAAQMLEIEIELKSLLDDIQSEKIDQLEFEARLQPLIDRQCELVESLHETMAPVERSH